MPEKSLENPIIPETQSNQEQAAEFLAAHAESGQETARRHFPPRPDSKLADQAGEIIGKNEATDGLPSIDAAKGDTDPEVEMLHRQLESAKTDVERIEILMNKTKNGAHPSDIMEAWNQIEK